MARGLTADTVKDLSDPLEAILASLIKAANSARIIGVGVDIEPIASFEGVHAPDLDATFVERAFTPEERAYCDSQAVPAQHFAARFAAKEAVVKACGQYARLTPFDVEIVRAESGAPTARIEGELASDIETLVSIGHAPPLAYAVAIALHRAEPAHA